MGLIGEAFVRIRPEMGGFAGEMKSGVAEAFSSVDSALSETAAGTQRVSAGFDDIIVRSKETVAAFTQQKNALLEEARTYGLLAQAASDGSEEQVAAATLAERAQKTLASSYGLVAGAAEESAAKAAAATRGAAAKTEESAATMKKSIGGLGAIGGLIVGAALTKFGYDSAKDAASVQKSNEVIREQFGKSGEAVKAFAEGAGVHLGIPVHESEAVSAKFGILFHNLHLGQGQAADMTVGLEKLGGSLAAIRGIDPSQALSSLSMAMLGNMRSLKQLGLSFSNAQISSEAMRLGLVKTASSTNAGKIANEALAIARARLTDTESKYAANTTQVASAQKAVQEAQDKVTAATTKAVGALTPAAKAQAIYALATQNLGGYQKEAAAHANDFANVQRRLGAEIDKVREEIGMKMLPIMTTFLKFLSDDLPKVLGPIVSTFERFKNVLIPVGAAIGTMVGVIVAWYGAVKVAAAAQIVWNATMDANPVGIVILAIAGLTAALVVLYERSNTVRRGIDETWGFLRESSQKVWGAIRVYVLDAWDMIKTYVVTYLKVIRDVFNVFKAAFTGDWRGAWHNIVKIFSDIWDGMGKIASDALDVIKRFAETKALEIGLVIVEPFSHIPRWLGGGWAQDLKKSMTSTLDGLQSSANAGGQGIGGAIVNGVQTGLTPLQTIVGNAIQSSVSGATADSPGRSGGAAARAAGHGTVYSQDQMAALLRQAGASPQLAGILASIGKNYESGGRAGIVSGLNKNGTRDYGLFQINSSHGYSQADMLDPLKNAQEALSIYRAQGFRAWTEAGGRAAVAQYGNWLGTGGSTGGGGGGMDTGLVVGTAAKKAKVFTAKQVASAQDALDQALKTIIHSADKNGVELTGTVKKHLDAVRKEIGGISNADDVRAARDHVKALGTAVADQVAALKTHLSLESAFQTVVTQIKKLGTDSTPQIAAQMAKVRAELGKAVTPTEVAKVRAQMTTLKNEISKQLEAIKVQVDAKKALFDAAWSRVASGMDAAFDKATQKALKSMQVTVTGAFNSFTFGGSVTQTPAEAALAKLQADHDAAAAASKTAADQAALDAAQRAGSADQIAAANDALAKSQRDLSAAQTAADIAQQKLTAAQAAAAKSTPLQIEQAQAALTSAQNRVTDLQTAVGNASDALTAASAPTDAATLAQLQAAVADDAYQAQVAALQNQAQAERDAATKQLQDAQDAYTAQRDLLKQQLDDRVSAIETGMLNGTIAAAAGMSELTTTLNDPQYGIDMQNSGLVLGGMLYKGLADSLAPTFAMLNDLLALMGKAGLLKGTPSGTPPPVKLPSGTTFADLLPAVAAANGKGFTVPGFSTDAAGQIVRAITAQTDALSGPPTIIVSVDGGPNKVAKAVAR